MDVVNRDGKTLTISDKAILVVKGDLTETSADALVNAANNHLWMGGGVAGALKRKGGKVIEDQAISKGPIPIGEAVITTAGDLKAKYVIHAAGMGIDLVTDADKIKAATYNALLRAHEVNLESIAFPAIGTGVGGFPPESAAECMLGVAIKFLSAEPKTTLKEIKFVLFDRETYQAFLSELEARLKNAKNS